MMRKFNSFSFRSLNYFAILVGFTGLHIDYAQMRIFESKLVNYYVVIANIITVVLLPPAHALFIKYITATFQNNLLVFTDSVNLFIHYIVVVFSIVSRYRRESIYKQISREIFKLDLSYFNKLPPNARIENGANWVFFIKLCTVIVVLFVPIYGVCQQAIRVDTNVIMLAVYSSLIHSLLNGVTFLFFLMLWQVRKRVWRLNAHLNELAHSQQRLYRNAIGILPSGSDTLQRLNGLAAEEMRQIARVHARLSTELLRLNYAYRWQIIAVLLTYIINCISYGYYSMASMDSSSHSFKSQSVLSIVASFVSNTIVFLDINLLYWVADGTAAACRHTAYIVRQFQALPLLEAAFEQQCETFALQLKQQKMHINIAGMFSLNRGTSLALWAFNARHILILVQFDYEARKHSNASSSALQHIIRLLQFGENSAEE